MAQPTKKPNSFSKGMMSDIDANALPADTYKSAINARLVTKEDNSFVLKNAKGNTLFTTFEDTEKTITFSDALALASTNITNLTTPELHGWKLTITGDNGFNEVVEFKNGYSLLSQAALILGEYTNGVLINSNLLMSAALITAISTPAISAKLNLSADPITSTGVYKIRYSNKTTEAMTLVITPWVQTGNPSNGSEGYAYKVYGGTLATLSQNKYEVVGQAEFSNYVAFITRGIGSNVQDTIFTLTPQSDFSSSVTKMILRTDLGLTAKTSLRVEVSEENEYFHRIYWTDGIQPLRTLNLKEAPEYYSTLTSDQLNLSKKSNLASPVVKSISPGGSVLCGSHSYAYRLITTDGKSSRVSNITNPVQVLQTSQNSEYHLSKGGPLSLQSSNSVHVEISDIDKSYGTIQIINIRYLSSEGAIEANIISEGAIVSDSFQYVHNGNETTTTISINELLKSHVSWDTCGDLAIKDNRLFAANLTNNAQSVDADFRVKSYKYTTALINSNGVSTTYSVKENPQIHYVNFYNDLRYNWLKRTYSTRVPGAQTDDFDTAATGVRVTFDTKRFNLTQVKYFENDGVGNSSNKAETMLGQVPHYGYITKNDNGSFENYKDPLFTSKFTGYQRGEIYRFGILFYDTQGNPTFVKPIGDIRMPDGTMDYLSIDASGNRRTTSDDGVTTFKHAGNIPTPLSGCVFSSGANTFVRSAGVSAINVNDVVTGTGIPKNTSVISISSTTVTLNQNTLSQGSNTTLTFDTLTDDVNGFALFPNFEVKLAQSILDKIGGYSIVRVDRTESDKSVLASGVLNQIIIHANVEGNESLRHKNGTHYGNIYTPLQGFETLSHTDFLFDTPESTLGKLQYSSKSTDTLKVVGRLDAGAQVTNSDNITHNDEVTDDDFHHLKNKINIATTGTTLTYRSRILAGRFDPKSNAALKSYQFSNKTIYSSYECSAVAINQATEAEGFNTIQYGSNVAPGETINKSRMGHDDNGTGRVNQSFTNRTRFQSDDKVFRHMPTALTTEKYESGEESNTGDTTMFGVDSIFISLGDSQNDKIRHANFDIASDSNDSTYSPFMLNLKSGNQDSAQKCFASKLYTQIRRNVEASQYGGSLTSNYENNQYISTGHVNFSPSTSNRDKIFGGDTYVNMYSLQKFKTGSTTFSSSKSYPSTAIMFPVESSINIDLRDGVFFGSTDDVSPSVHDNFLINETYSCRNSTKTFLPKPTNFKDVNNYGNLIAASNIKLAGDLFDAYSTFDANEIHELDNNKGAIFNLFNLRNELFALQTKGVSKLSINPRVVVDNADAAAVTIVTGTGQIIQRSDYIDTLYGSQHFNNMMITNTSAYWFDSNMSSFCKLVFGKGIVVQDLGLTTQNSNIFNALKNSSIGDKPLDYAVGGISLYNNKVFDEVGICITTANNASVTHMVYSELRDLMITKKEDVIAMAFNLPGELLTVGRNNATSSIDLSKVYREDVNTSHISYYEVNNTNSLDVTFVCNENVYSSKKFDKLVMYLSGNENAQKFTTFTFTDSVSNSSFASNATLSRTANGKHIIPITNTAGTAKATGQYLIIRTQSTNTGLIELFGTLIHNRTTT